MKENELAGNADRAAVELAKQNRPCFVFKDTLRILPPNARSLHLGVHDARLRRLVIQKQVRNRRVTSSRLSIRY